jgi:hypothetical protein
MKIFTAAKGKTITLDDLPAERAAWKDKAVVLHKGEYFIATYDYTQNGLGWAIWHEYGFKSTFIAMQECEGVYFSNATLKWHRSDECVEI